MKKERTIKKVESLKGSNGKALIKTMTDGSRVLQSYYTDVLEISKTGKITVLWNGWSCTTGKHIKAFCGLNKKELEKLNGGKLEKAFDFCDYLTPAETTELKNTLKYQIA